MPGAAEREPETETVAQEAPSEVVVPGAAPTLVARALAIQRAAGNAALVRHLQRQPVAAPPAPQKPALVQHTWKNQELGKIVEGSDPASKIAEYLANLSPQARDEAMADLQGARSDYRGHLTGADKDKKTAIKEQMERVDVTLQSEYSQIASVVAPGKTAPEGGWAPGTRPSELTSATHTPTQAERDRVRGLLSKSGPGALPDFKSQLPNQFWAWEHRVSRELHARIDRGQKLLVEGKGPKEHADERNLNPWKRYEELAAIAKEETDAIFGSYVRGPAFKHGNSFHKGNLRDRWQEEREHQGTLGKQGRREQAEALVQYLFVSSEPIDEINKQHGAVPTRDTLSPGESQSEAAMLTGIIQRIAAAREQTLLDIDRGWTGTASDGIVSLQRWKRPTPELQREHYWVSMQTMIHEYLHTLTHPLYRTYAESLPGGGGGPAWNVMIEGMTSAMTDIVWINTAPKVKQEAFARRVEAETYVGADASKVACPIHPARYPSYDQAMEIISTVGPRNAFAAYLLGEVDLIKASTP